ncbi:GroES-like protein [Ceratobasidium sp. AG-I]|nr:GroES-like protein [Ceratobasidium sp. AG-I]
MTQFSMPQNMKVLIAQEGKTVKVQDIPVPTIDQNEVLIKVHSVALNPGDWMYVDHIAQPGNIIGSDISGTVVKLGSDSITNVRIGDTVSTFVHGGNYTDRGAFAQYAKADSDLVWRFSTNTLSFDQAATLGCTLWTSIQALYHRIGLRDSPSDVKGGEWVLIYGGSTSVGLYSIQLAKLSGYKVVTTVSPKNFKLVGSLGADAVVDYNSSDIVEQIQKATGNSLRVAFDTVSNATTQTICAKSISPTPEDAAPGKIIVVLPPDEEAQALRKDIEIRNTTVYTSFGRAFALPTVEFPALPADREHMASWIPKIKDLVDSGKIKPNPVKVWAGGLEAISEGLQYMRDGKVSGEKIVYNI